MFRVAITLELHCPLMVATSHMSLWSIWNAESLNWDAVQCEMGCPGGSDGEESACNPEDLGLIPGSGRSPGEGKGYPHLYSCLQNSTDRGAWRATVHGIAASDTTEQLTLSHFQCEIHTTFQRLTWKKNVKNLMRHFTLSTCWNDNILGILCLIKIFKIWNSTYCVLMWLLENFKIT